MNIVFFEAPKALIAPCGEFDETFSRQKEEMAALQNPLWSKDQEGTLINVGHCRGNLLVEILSAQVAEVKVSCNFGTAGVVEGKGQRYVKLALDIDLAYDPWSLTIEVVGQPAVQLDMPAFRPK